MSDGLLPFKVGGEESNGSDMAIGMALYELFAVAFTTLTGLKNDLSDC